MGEAKPASKRTAVLVVHGMGSQRPLDTVRGVVKAIWRDEKANKVWFHPEPTGTDIDLTVITTSAIPDTDGKRADFHELYWAHLLSETRGVAVLLWLFELARRGPYLNPRMKNVWWGGAIFLALLVLSACFLVLQTIEKLSDAVDERHALIVTPVLMLVIALGLALGASMLAGTGRFTAAVARGLAGIAFGSVIVCAAGAALLTVMYDVRWLGLDWNGLNCGRYDGISLADGVLVAGLKAVTMWLLPLGLAAVVCALVMGRNGLKPLFWVYGGSLLFFAIYAVVLRLTGGSVTEAVCVGWVPWSLESQWTAVAAWVTIALYLVANAAFLTPYLGDAARYFRDSPANVEGRREIRKQAVNTLAYLHDCGKYDRIVVVAHSLGTVVAYDMLRAYFSRIRNDMPDAAGLGSEIGDIDKGIESRDIAWTKARTVIANMARIPRQPSDSGPVPKVWLVTDFVTLGSPLTHAEYLMCRGNDKTQLEKDLERRRNEREFPTCPPRQLDGDGCLTKNASGRQFHHGAVFGLTRWTNLYFPMSELLWGDAIGGQVGSVEKQSLFGRHVRDVEVSTHSDGRAGLFTHTKYWDAKPRDPDAAPEPLEPHIQALKDAINLADKLPDGRAFSSEVESTSHGENASV